jgi:hypothetical protein
VVHKKSTLIVVIDLDREAIYPYVDLLFPTVAVWLGDVKRVRIKISVLKAGADVVVVFG